MDTFWFPLEEGEDEQKFWLFLHRACSCVEDFELTFGVELSCGDGKFLSDEFEGWEDYDGRVCMQSLPRDIVTKKLLKAGKSYRFEIHEGKNYLYFKLNGKTKSKIEKL